MVKCLTQFEVFKFIFTGVENKTLHALNRAIGGHFEGHSPVFRCGDIIPCCPVFGVIFVPKLKITCFESFKGNGEISEIIITHTGKIILTYRNI